jgi:CRP-like cAMP-binding protein
MSDDTPTLSTGLFAGLSADDADGILQAGERLSFPAGTTIFETGDRVDVGGRFHVLKAGAFFGEMALLAPGPRMATIKAQSDVEAIKIGAGEFQSFLLDHPAVALSMMKQLVLRLREVEQRIDAWMA